MNMKRTYNKPTLKSVNLWSAEQLMTGSDEKLVIGEEGNTVTGKDALSNQEGAHDIWGNGNNGIW